MEWHVFIDWMLKALLGGTVLHGVRVLTEMKNSIDKLNHTMAKIIERTEWHSREISRMETRIMRLEGMK